MQLFNKSFIKYPMFIKIEKYALYIIFLNLNDSQFKTENKKYELENFDTYSWHTN